MPAFLTNHKHFGVVKISHCVILRCTGDDFLEKNHNSNFLIVQRVIAFLDDANHSATLSEVAHEMNISPNKLINILTNWGFVDPVDFSTYLSQGFSRSIPLTTDVPVSNHIATNIHVTDAHDPALEQIFYNHIDTPFGPALALATLHGICGLGFSAKVGMDETKHDFMSRWPNAQFIQSPEHLTHYENMMFDDDRIVPMHLIGSPFYVKVWKALLEIPKGYASTYSDVAVRAGNLRAVRAVGTAIGKNPISWLIPCHRVLRKDGSLGGYHWGTGIKRAMLAYEALKIQN